MPLKDYRSLCFWDSQAWFLNFGKKHGWQDQLPSLGLGLVCALEGREKYTL